MLPRSPTARALLLAVAASLFVDPLRVLAPSLRGGAAATASGVAESASTATAAAAAATAARCDFATRAEWAVFLHSNPANDWRVVLDDQVKTLHDSPLRECGVGAGSAGVAERARFFYGFQRGTAWPYSPDAAFAPYNESASTLGAANSERTTLQPLFEWCAARPRALVAYVHDKGTRTSAAENVERFLRQWDWRRLHEYFVLERPAGCFQHLLDEQYDTCGANLRLDPSVHFSGNFWWARCDYVRQLEPPATYRAGDELAPERWIGSLDEQGGARSGRHFECFNSGVVHSFARYPRSEYFGRTC